MNARQVRELRADLESMTEEVRRLVHEAEQLEAQAGALRAESVRLALRFMRCQMNANANVKEVKRG